MIWLELPENHHCKTGRIRFWQRYLGVTSHLPERSDWLPWALDSVVIGGRWPEPPTSLLGGDFTSYHWIHMYNLEMGKCTDFIIPTSNVLFIAIVNNTGEIFRKYLWRINYVSLSFR